MPDKNWNLGNTYPVSIWNRSSKRVVFTLKEDFNESHKISTVWTPQWFLNWTHFKQFNIEILIELKNWQGQFPDIQL